MTHHDPEIKQIPENPYATPAVQPPLVAPMGAATEFSHLIFQKDGLLIVHKKATLPDRCLKSNEPTQSRLKRSLYWHHPALYLLILLHIVIYAIVAIIIRKSAVFWIPLQERYKKKRRRDMAIAWFSVLLGIGLFILGIAVVDGNSTVGVTCLLLSPFLILGGALFGIFRCRIVYAKRIDDHFVWLKGVSPDFQREYPEWPYAMK